MSAINARTQGKSRRRRVRGDGGKSVRQSVRTAALAEAAETRRRARAAEVAAPS
jgi:hypothetical protein